jgi:hypothetical protein
MECNRGGLVMEEVFNIDDLVKKMRNDAFLHIKHYADSHTTDQVGGYAKGIIDAVDFAIYEINEMRGGEDTDEG